MYAAIGRRGDMPNFLSNSFSYTLSILRDHDWVLVILLFAVFTLILVIFTRRLWSDARILQRAYIAVEPLGIHLMKNGSHLIGHVGIKNAGHLPARKLSWFINIRFGHSEEERDDFFPLQQGKGNIIIAPGAIATRDSGISVKVQTLNEFCRAAAGVSRDSERPTYLYVWGAVEYDDGFNKMRTTKFCHRYNWTNRGRGDVENYEIAAEYARYHEHGNDAN
jgi:hypothetical protein